MEGQRVYIVLPVHNRKKITLSFIETLRNQTYKNYQLILVDDGCTDGTSEAVSAIELSTTILRGDGGLWWAGSLQKGIDWIKLNARSTESIVMFVNDDTLLTDHFLETGVKLVSESTKTLFCAQAFSQLTGKRVDYGVWIDWFRFQFKPVKDESEVNCVTTRGLFLRLKDFEEIGEFLPQILPHYYSDYEFTHRAWKKGYRLSLPDSLRLQMNDATTGLQSAEGFTLRQYFKKTFQIRSAINPWTAVKFIRVAAPVWLKPFAYFRVFIYFLKSVVQSALRGF